MRYLIEIKGTYEQKERELKPGEAMTHGATGIFPIKEERFIEATSDKKAREEAKKITKNWKVYTESSYPTPITINIMSSEIYRLEKIS